MALVETESDGRIRRFLEKPKADEITCNTINAGTYILEPKVLDFLPPERTIRLSMDSFRSPEAERTILRSRANQNVLDRHSTPQRYLQVHADLLANRVGRIHIKERRGTFDSATVAEIDEASMIGDDCR